MIISKKDMQVHVYMQVTHGIELNQYTIIVFPTTLSINLL